MIDTQPDATSTCLRDITSSNSNATDYGGTNACQMSLQDLTDDPVGTASSEYRML